MFWYTMCGWLLISKNFPPLHYIYNGFNKRGFYRLKALLAYWSLFSIFGHIFGTYIPDPSLFTYIHLHKIPLFTDFRILWAVYSLGNIIRPRLKTLRLLSSLLLPLERHRHLVCTTTHLVYYRGWPKW